MENKKKSVFCDSIKQLEAQQVTVSANIQLDGITKLLMSNQTAALLGVECLAGELVVNGRVNFKVLYSEEGDTAGKDVNSDFTARIKDESISADSKCPVTLSVIDLETSMENGNVLLTAVVEIGIALITTTECQALSEAGEGDIAKYGNAPFVRYSIREDRLPISEEIKLKNIDKLLLLDSDGEILTSSNEDGGVKLTGLVTANLVYSYDGAVLLESYEIPFTEYIEETTGEFLPYAVYMRSSRIVVGEGDDAVFEGELSVYSLVATYGEERVVEDIYSTQYLLTSQQCCYTFGKPTQGFVERQKIQGEAELEVAGARITSATAIRNVVTNLVPYAGELTIEGLTLSSIVYFDGALHSVEVELPYSITVKNPAITEQSRVLVRVLPTEVNARISGNTLEARATLVLIVTLCEEQRICLVTSCERGEACDNSGFCILFPQRDMTLFEVAKELCVAEDELLKQNPELEDSVAKGDRIAIWRGQKME